MPRIHIFQYFMDVRNKSEHDDGENFELCQQSGAPEQSGALSDAKKACDEPIRALSVEKQRQAHDLFDVTLNYTAPTTTFNKKPNRKSILGVLMRFFFAVFLLFASIDIAVAVGIQRISVPNPIDGETSLKGAVWYPCAEAESTVSFRDVEMDGTLNCEVIGTALPLVVISHGARGWFGGHHDTAAALANAGYVVAAISHPDKGRSWQTNRPAAVKQLIDYMLDTWPERDRLDAQRIGFFGFSRGGYTGLVLLGGKPRFHKFLLHCLLSWNDPMCKRPPGSSETNDETPRVEGFTHDPRIKAAVIAAPVGLVFSGDSLSNVRTPIQLWRAEADQLLIYPNHAEVIYEALPTKPAYHVVPDAGHFVFLAPCNETQRRAARMICEDEPGFDRVQFHDSMNADVIGFFDKQLSAQ